MKYKIDFLIDYYFNFAWFGKDTMESNRKSGLDFVGNISWGTHICHLYESKQDLLDIMIPFVIAGLNNNELCFWVTDNTLSESESRDFLFKSLPQFKISEKQQQLFIIPFTSLFGKSGHFNKEELLKSWQEREKSAINQGFEGLRVAIVISGLENTLCWNEFIEYENGVINYINNLNMICLCSFNLNNCQKIDLIEIIQTHEFALIKRENSWQKRENISYKVIRQDLAECYEKFQNLFYQMNEGIAIHKLIYDKSGYVIDYRILDINPAYELITGFNRHNAIGKISTDLYQTKTPPYLDIFTSVSKTGIPKSIETYFEPIDKNVRISAFSLPKGEFILIFNDLTLIKRNEIEKANLSSFPELNPNPVIEMDTYGAINYMNPASLKYFPTLKDQGKNHPLLRDWDTLVIKLNTQKQIQISRDVQIGESWYSQCISRSSKENFYRIYNWDISNQKKTESELKKYQESLEQMIEDRTKSLQLMNSSLKEEIANRIKAEKITQAEHQKYNAILETLPCYLILLNLDYHVIFANKFFRDRFGESNGRRCYEYLFQRTEPCEICDTYKTLKTMKPLEWEWLGPDQHNYYIYDFPFKDTDGSTLIMEAGIDVSETKKNQKLLQEMNAKLDQIVQERTADLKKRTDELIRSNEELEMFASVASHDLKEPIRSIMSFSQLLENRSSNVLMPESQKYLTRIIENASHMSVLINNILDYSRIQTQSVPFIEVNLNKVIKNVLTNLSASITSSNAIILYDSLPNVKGDESQILRLFQNLIENALKFKKENCIPEIHISLDSTLEKEWQISIKDNGIGIDPNYFNTLFKVFKRLHSQDQYPGTGIGLAMCKRIINNHEGKIWIESMVENGTTFHITFPKK